MNVISAQNATGDTNLSAVIFFYKITGNAMMLAPIMQHMRMRFAFGFVFPPATDTAMSPIMIKQDTTGPKSANTSAPFTRFAPEEKPTPHSWS